MLTPSEMPEQIMVSLETGRTGQDSHSPASVFCLFGLFLSICFEAESHIAQAGLKADVAKDDFELPPPLGFCGPQDFRCAKQTLYHLSTTHNLMDHQVL